MRLLQLPLLPGQSVHYGKQISINDANEFTLNYTTYEEAMVKPGTPIYSTENTNIADNIRVDATKTSGLVPAKVTCLILTAQVFTDEACTTPLELVDFNNTYFTRPQFRKYVLQRLTDGGGLNYYKRPEQAQKQILTNTPRSAPTTSSLLTATTPPPALS